MSRTALGPAALLEPGYRLDPESAARCRAAVLRINRVCRLLSYGSVIDRKRYRRQCEEHLRILDLLERYRNADASQALRRRLEHTIQSLQEIRPVLER